MDAIRPLMRSAVLVSWCMRLPKRSLIDALAHLEQRAGSRAACGNKFMITSSRLTSSSMLKASMASVSGVLSTMPPSQ